MERNTGDIDLRTDAMKALLLQNPFQYPSWAPKADAWDAQNISRITDLRIPKTSEQGGRVGGPDLILYRLGHLGDLDPSFDDRISDLTSGSHHTVLVNASGSGKTRMTLEILYRHWGFYLGSDLDYTVNPYGSADFPDVVRSLSAIGTVTLTPRKKRVALLEANQRWVDQRLRQVMLSRLLVFDNFVTLADSADIPEADARAKWLWLQLRPSDLLGRDVFCSVYYALSSWSEMSVSTRMEQLLGQHRERLKFVVLDEAQIPAIHARYSFLTSDHRRYQPLLHAFVAYLASTFTASKLIVSGTEVPLSVVQDAIISSNHPIRDASPFTDLGDFGSIDRTSNYLRHFLGADLSAEHCELSHRWLRGRHRMIAVLVNRTLRFGRAQFAGIIDSIIRSTTGFDRRTDKNADMPGVGLSLVVRDQTLEGTNLAPPLLSPALRSAAYIYLTHGMPAIFHHNCEQLVGIGLARFGDTITSACVDEPIMLLNIARWLETSRVFSTAAIIRRRIRDSSSSVKGLALAEAFAYSLWRSFGASGLRIDQIANFTGDTPPWASRPARFALTALRNGRRAFRKVSSSPCPLVRVAQNSDEVMEWFANSTTPFLIPDPEFGAQLVFFLATTPVQKLVMIHLDPFDRERPHRDNRVVPRHPTSFYPQDRLSRSRFSEILSSFASTQAASARSSAAHSSNQPSLNTLQIYCFADLYRSNHPYNPPVATMRLRDLLSEGQLVEIAPAAIADTLA